MSKDILILIMPFIISGGQVLFKIASRDVAAFDHNSLVRLSMNGYFIVALILYGIATLLWVYILKHFPLSKAYLFMGLSFILVPVMSYIFLKEPLSLRFMAGAFCIVFGIWLARAA
ncbi:EamA family transporter [Sneathiella sp. HT1-7]|uniref:EamA family transporter n=1 Tax=Sneathiella sp. HT1-7 TaxID=2887192 RepID=UPI001D14B250|nr:EamA family transporter [Sneathiella sp. HT1-7]MCC3304135.1 EamA family transporter [Sneathiella sp. HT1-7]